MIRFFDRNAAGVSSCMIEVDFDRGPVGGQCEVLRPLDGRVASLCRCLSSTNLIGSPHSGVRLRTRRICRWRDGRTILRWAAAAFVMTEKNFRKIQGHRNLWMLKAALEPSRKENQATSMEQVA